MINTPQPAVLPSAKVDQARTLVPLIFRRNNEFVVNGLRYPSFLGLRLQSLRSTGTHRRNRAFPARSRSHPLCIAHGLHLRFLAARLLVKQYEPHDIHPEGMYVQYLTPGTRYLGICYGKNISSAVDEESNKLTGRFYCAHPFKTGARHRNCVRAGPSLLARALHGRLAVRRRRRNGGHGGIRHPSSRGVLRGPRVPHAVVDGTASVPGNGQPCSSGDVVASLRPSRRCGRIWTCRCVCSGKTGGRAGGVVFAG